MKKKIYQQPKVKVTELDGETILSGSGVSARQLNYQEEILDDDFE